MLRIPPGLHATLRAAAAAAGVSLNDHCGQRLAAPFGEAAVHRGAAEAMRRASAVLGEALAGLAMFGSWTRGDAGPGSDVDALVVAASDVRLGRALYRAWDDGAGPQGGACRVEPRFVHLPSPGARTSGLWAEVAVDGIVLFDRDLALSRYLVMIRRAIADGRLSRREVHGQPYWTEVA